MTEEEFNQAQEQQKRKKRRGNAVPFQKLEDCMEKLGIGSDAEMSRQLGLSSNVVAKWRSDDECPKWAAISAWGLVIKMEWEKARPSLLIVEVPAHAKEQFMRIAEAAAPSARITEIEN